LSSEATGSAHFLTKWRSLLEQNQERTVGDVAATRWEEWLAAAMEG